MVKATKNREETVAGRTGLADAYAVVDYYVGDLFGIAWKLALFYAVWIGAGYLAMTNASTVAGGQISAIGFWFGWLFLAATVALGVAVTLLGLADRVRLNRSKRKY